MEYAHIGKANFLQRPPVTDATYLFEDVYFNPFLLQLANASVVLPSPTSISFAHPTLSLVSPSAS